MRAHLRDGRLVKYLNENLAPLRRFLAGSVGRPWSKIYAELAEHLKPASAVQQHVRDHLKDFVALRAVVLGGRLFDATNWPRRVWAGDLFVCPRTGLLKIARGEPAPRHRRVGSAALVRLIDERRAARIEHGAWFEFTLAPLPPLEQRVATDVLLGVPVHGHEHDIARAIGRPGVYTVAKRQLGKREILRLALRDGEPPRARA